MNPRNLIRTAAATLAATTFLFAQSAPLPVAGAAPAARASTISPERLQVRLAEVIAMLEEDDLTAEQRDSAKKKLQEISARLKAASANTAGPSAPRVRANALVAPVAPVTAVEPVDPVAPPRARAPRAPMPPVEVEVVQDPAPRSTRAAKPVEVENMRSAAEKLQTEAKVMRARAEAQKAKVKHDAEVVEGIEAKAKNAWRVALKAKADAEAAEQEPMRYRVLKSAEGEKIDVVEVKQPAKSPMVLQLLDGATAETKAVRTPKPKPKVQGFDDMTEVRSVRGFAGLPAARKASKHADADDDDDEVLELLQQMRAEMREIKRMLQELKGQQTRQSRQVRTRAATPGQSLGGVGAFGGESGSGGGSQVRSYPAFGGAASGSGGSKARAFTLFGAGEEAKPKRVAGTFSQNGDFKVLEAEGGDIFVVEKPAQGMHYEWKTGSGGADQPKVLEVVAPKATSGKRVAVRAVGGGDDEMN